MKKCKNKKLVLSIAKTTLAVLGEVAGGQIEAFWPHPYYHRFCEHAKRESLYKTIYDLEKRGLIKTYKNKNERNIVLTREGKKKSASIRLFIKMADIFIGPQKSAWDGRWRIIIFDIPEKYRKMRDELRAHLEILNFFQLQKSVWVHPLPIPKDFFTDFINPTLRSYIRLIVADSIDQEKDLKDYFFVDL